MVIMTRAELAINGGEPAIRGPLRTYNSIGELEIEYANDAMKRGPLSGYLGGNPNGGYWCERLEAIMADKFNVNHAIAVNSATSGILAALYAAGCGKGSLVATSPYTMSGTIAPAAVLNARIGFYDIEPKTFNLDLSCLEGDYPEFLIVPNIFGHPAELSKIRKYCDGYDIIMIEDNAQSPFAMEYGKYAGTIGHIGVFSLNVHKHIQCGEGGIVVTNDDTFADKVRGFRNHGELSGGFAGLNLRMTEVTAAIACAQIERSYELIASRIAYAERLNEIVQPYEEFIIPPFVREGCKHVYYTLAAKIPRGRDWFCSALRAEGMPISSGYSKIFELPAFLRDSGDFPITNLVDSQLVMVEICAHDPSEDQFKQIQEAFDKVCEDAVKTASRRQKNA